MQHPDSNLVSVFRTDDPGVLPLATMALETERIEYFVRSAGKADSMDWARSQKPTIRPEVLEILVAQDVADRARDLLVDLEQLDDRPVAPPLTETESLSGSQAGTEAPAITLEDATTGSPLATITEEQLQELTSRLEEDQPQTYAITEETIERLEKADIDPQLLQVLRQAIPPGAGGVVVRWVVR